MGGQTRFVPRVDPLVAVLSTLTPLLWEPFFLSFPLFFAPVMPLSDKLVPSFCWLGSGRLQGEGMG